MTDYSYIRKSFRDSNGVRHWVRGKTEEEAIIKREQLRQKIQTEELSKSSTALFRDWAEIALDTYKADVSDKYMVCIHSRLNRYILPMIGNVPISKVTPLQCQQIMNQVSGMSRSMISSIRPAER